MSPYETVIFDNNRARIKRLQNAADDRLAALAEDGDIAITRDIPLAFRLVEKNVHTLDDRGRVFTQDNIRYCLSLRNFNIAISGNGKYDRAASYGCKEKKTFADSLDGIITSVTSPRSPKILPRQKV